MPWVKVDEHFYDHPKWADAPGDSIALWLAAMAWCNRNDSTSGFIPDAKTRGLVNVRQLGRTLQDLTQREAFHKVAGGYVVHDYEEYQQPERVREIAGKRAAAGRKGAAHRWAEKRRQAEIDDGTGPGNDMANEIASAMANGPAGEWPDSDSDSVSWLQAQDDSRGVSANGGLDSVLSRLSEQFRGER